ncbi:CreB-regulated gene B protein [Leminorella richardii]|uniref:Inner membrane protein CbrB n=1 Tax=Leminorella richardii TaxID=158841 RepID=A0A2X4UHE4_9GAMM|nr:hypothetical protein [Leminorella richardii]SQI38423.1 CreB-regulated gene B protein [Leminorella richardii]
MTLGYRTLCHAFWFSLIGPIVGFLYIAFVVMLPGSTDKATTASFFPILFFISYALGVLPALLTGIGAACLPVRHYRSTLYRTAFCTILGSVLTLLFFTVVFGVQDVLIGTDRPGSLLHRFNLYVAPGTLSGAIMALITPKGFYFADRP